MRVLVAEDAAAPAEVVAEGLRGQGMAAPDDRVEGLSLRGRRPPGQAFHFPEPVLLRQARGRVLRAGGLELDRRLRAATRDGVPLALSVKEFELLHALLRAAPG